MLMFHNKALNLFTKSCREIKKIKLIEFLFVFKIPFWLQNYIDHKFQRNDWKYIDQHTYKFVVDLSWLI